ncbi:unnamed protein product [Schistosoma mattheei]|uniref:Uncharacterized protein n=1 Tax=Schistosoma mattheei TaxID=31246 RepID=A0A183Q2X3_9TREM|nr:unnamed protein product [Schistosoma mattheei]
MEDVRTRRGADIASYRHLLGGCRDETEANEVLDNWTNSITKDLLKEESTMEDNWKGIKEVLHSTYQKVLGRKKRHHK